MKIRNLIAASCLALATVLSATALAQQTSQPKLYKWVDKDGVVHYGASVPPEYASQQKDVLNSEGITVQTLPAQQTPAELAKQAQEKAAAAATAAALQQQQLHDQVLMDTYTSVGDMERDRDSQLAGLDAQINVTNTAISGLQKTLAGLQQREAALTHAGKPVPAPLQKQASDTQQQLTTYQKLLLKQQQDKEDTRARFTADIERFKLLTGTQNQPQGGGN